MASTTSLTFFSSSIFHYSSSPSLKKSLSPNLQTPILKIQFPKHAHHPKPLRAQLATLPILSFSGEKVGDATIDLKSALPETARAVVHRGLITDQQNQRRGTASTLTRAEVKGGGKKPYQQKKTGRARRGSQRTPLRPGGGVIFGPKPRDWSIKINRKEKRLALSTALISAAENTIVIDDFAHQFERPRTKEFIAAMKRWGVDPSASSMLFCTEVSDNVRLSSRNIGTLKVLTPRTLNLFDILNSEKLIFTKSAVEYLNKMYGMSSNDEEEDEDEDEAQEEGESAPATVSMPIKERSLLWLKGGEEKLRKFSQTQKGLIGSRSFMATIASSTS